MRLDWNSCEGNVWCPLSNLNLQHPHFSDAEGVYVIWSGNRVVRVGQGVISDRLSAHRNDPAVTRYADLRATWAKVAGVYRDGVERFLGDALKPLVGDAFPAAVPIPVNFPW